MSTTNNKLIRTDEQYQEWVKTGRNYLKAGFSIIPVGNNKIPLIVWKKYQTEKATIKDIKEWCKSPQFTGFGIVTGKISDLFVLDLDNGADTTDLNIPDTVSVETGSGGSHYYFKYPKNNSFGNSAGFRKKMDIRGEGGYVVAPPALHPSGNKYKWIKDIKTPIAEVPEWLLNELQEKKESLSDWVNKSEILQGVSESKRNESAAKVAGKLLATLPQEEWQTIVWELMKGWNLRCTPPLDEQELRSVFESIAKRELGKRTRRKETKEVKGFVVKTTESGRIEAKKGVFEYHLKQFGRKTQTRLYLNEEIIHSDQFSLSSDKSRKMFVNASGKLSDEQKRTVIKDLLVLGEVIDIVNSNVYKERQEKENRKLTDEEKSEAEKLLESPTLLYDILQIIKGVGVAGEEKNALIFYLVFTSRITEEPLSVVVKGESSAGKSYVVIKVMKLFPENAYIDLTDATAQSFFYAPKGRFAHKTILIFEKHGGEKADYSIRTLQSEKKLKIQHTVRNPSTGEWETKEKEVDGVVGFITTTTEAVIHNENETRNLSIFPDESEVQTKKTFEVTDAKYRGLGELTDEKLLVWQNLQLNLKSYEVLIPFVEKVRDSFPKKPIRVRRDYGKLLALIAVITLLHQRQREVVNNNDKEYLVATLTDFHIAKILLEETLKKTIYSLPPKSEEIISAALVLGNEFSIGEIAGKLDWDYDTAHKWFKPAYQKGYFKKVEEHKGSSAAKYELTGKDASESIIFPETEKLFELNPRWLGKSRIYDPISGEVYRFEPNEVSTDDPMPSGVV